MFPLKQKILWDFHEPHHPAKPKSAKKKEDNVQQNSQVVQK